MILVILTIVLPVLLVVGITILSARRKVAASGDSDSDSQSFVGGVLNALFAVVLAFYIVFAWQNGDDIEKQSTAEANGLIDTYWLVDAAPAAQSADIRTSIRQYATRVADHEWNILAHGNRDPTADELLLSIRSGVTNLATDTEEAKIARELSLHNVREIEENHRERVTQATDDDVFTTVLLIGSIIGAVLMVAFPLLIGLSPRPANVVGMALLTAALGCLVYVSLELVNPLEGAFGNEPDAFRVATELFSGTVRPG